MRLLQHRGTENTETHRASGLARRPAAVVSVEWRSAAARRIGSCASRVHGSPLALTALRAVPGLRVFAIFAVFYVCCGLTIANGGRTSDTRGHGDRQEDACRGLQVRHRACAVLGVK